MLTVSKILETIPHEVCIEAKKLEKILKLTKKAERDKLQIALIALNKLGLIQQNDLGSFIKINNNAFIQGRLRCSTKGYCFAVRNDGGEDIYIRDQHLNSAWHGDSVLVKITREGIRRRSPEGQIQCILERNTETLVCVLDQDEENIIGIPLEERILSTISLPKKDKKYLQTQLLDNVVEVKIDKYPIAQYPAEGHVISNLPLNDGGKSDHKFILAKVGLQDNNQRPKASIKNPSTKNRIDLTSQESLIFRSWKKENSPPLPALYIEANAGGAKVYIHIPTISERIGIGTSNDIWLRNEGEAYCLGNYWRSLLDEALTTSSSFKTNEENSAITLRLDIGANGCISDWEFNLSTIKPVAEITPELLEVINKRKPKSRVIPLKIKPIKQYLSQIETLLYISELLNKREKKLGSIELDLSLPKIDSLTQLMYEDPSSSINQWNRPLDKNDPQSVISPILRISNKVYMEHIIGLKLPGYFIQSQEIEVNTLNEVAKIAIALDLELELDEEGIISAAELSQAFAKNPCRRVLDKLLKNYLPEATLNTYIPSKEENTNTNNLSSEDITLESSAPFTSPGSHYYEIANQHVLVTLLSEGKSKPTTRSKRKVDLGKRGAWKDLDWDLFSETTYKMLYQIFDSINLNKHHKTQRQAHLLRSQVISMSKSRSAEKYVGKDVEATISGVQSYGFFAELPPDLSEGLVHVSSLNDDWYEYRSRQNRLVGRKSRKSYQLGDKVLVKVLKVDILRNQIDLDVVNNPVDTTDDTDIKSSEIIDKDKTTSIGD